MENKSIMLNYENWKELLDIKTSEHLISMNQVISYLLNIKYEWYSKQC